MRLIVQNLPIYDMERASAALAHLLQKGVSPDFAAKGAWLAGVIAKNNFSLRHPRLAIFAGQTLDASTEEKTSLINRIERLSRADDVLARLAQSVDADLRLYEMALEDPNASFLGEAELCNAMSYGMMAVENGVHILSLSCMGAGSDGWTRKMFIEAQNSLGSKDAFDILLSFPSAEIAACFGTILASGMARVPLLLDGDSALIAAYLLSRNNSRLVDHCWPVHYPQDAYGKILEAHFRKSPLHTGVDWDIGTASALQFKLFEALADLLR